MDFWIGTFGIYVLATIQIIIGAWIFGVDKVYEEAHKGSLIKIPKFLNL
jgi:NSS family neurotransmitter:Na+ symporter